MRVVVLFAALIATSAFAVSYPKDFIWGVAFSAHQAEGITGGGEASNWYAFEHQTPSPIANADTADIAVDHWNRYKEDIALAKSLGVDSIRTSLAWEKIEPKAGVFNEAAISHYRDVLIEMRAQGLRPMIALHHFSNPIWFDQAGGWVSSKSPQLFLEYANFVLSRLGDLCDVWISFNEPMLYAYNGYFLGKIPPAHHSIFDAFDAAYNLARAHRMFAARVHVVQGPSPFGRGSHGELRGAATVNNFQLFQPADPTFFMDVNAANDLMELMNWSFIRAVESGHMILRVPFSIVPLTYDRVMPESDLPWPTPGPFFDWIGVNYYARSVVRRNLDPLNPIVPVESGDPKADNGWNIYPEGLEIIARETAKRFAYPIVISENGLADADDSKRPQFIRDHLAQVDRLLLGSEKGPPLDIRGYYHWSLFDNFEWVEGYRYRFGLFEVRYDQGLERVARGSASVFRQSISDRR